MPQGYPSYGMSRDPYKGQKSGLPNTKKFAKQNPTKIKLHNRANYQMKKVFKTK